jgi:23S rRNA pseudouridine2605 synthase
MLEFCSRRKADEMIKEGRVTVNKKEAIIGMDNTHPMIL